MTEYIDIESTEGYVLVGDPLYGGLVVHARACPVVALADALGWPMSSVPYGIEAVAHVPCVVGENA